MKTVAVYNMKGGVGKTTTAVNLSYLAAASGRRTLLWDLDPQAASSFAFRVQPRVAGFSKRTLEDGDALAAAIKETDYHNLHLVPADFAYRKIDRFLGSLGKPERLIRSLLDTLGREFDLVFLDCPAGFSLLTEGVFAAADAMLAPTIPNVLSLRMVARLIKWASRSGARVKLAAFFSMVDRRKALHRRASEWSMQNPEVFLRSSIPYASVVEQMAARRLPLAESAPREAATTAFADMWAELQIRLDRGVAKTPEDSEWLRMLHVVESLIANLEPEERDESQAYGFTPTTRNEERGGWAHLQRTDVSLVHRFDTDRRDLEQNGQLLELYERNGNFFVAVSEVKAEQQHESARTEVQIDKSWAAQILAGTMSPMTALERRLGHPEPRPVEEIRWIASGRKLRRIDTRVARSPGQLNARGSEAITPIDKRWLHPLRVR